MCRLELDRLSTSIRLSQTQKCERFLPRCAKAGTSTWSSFRCLPFPPKSIVAPSSPIPAATTEQKHNKQNDYNCFHDLHLDPLRPPPLFSRTVDKPVQITG